MDPKTAIHSFIFWSIFQNTMASSCELVIRITDLQEIIKNQTKVIQSQNGDKEELRGLVENQAAVIKDLRKTVEHLTIGKGVCCCGDYNTHRR